MNAYESPRSLRHGVTMVELIIVIAVIVVLMAILLPALASVRKQSLMASSQSNLRQIGHWVELYARDNRDTVLPSQFDYTNNSNTGHVRSVVTIGDLNTGTWSDILWTIHQLGAFTGEVAGPGGTANNAYRFDAPDRWLYDAAGGSFKNPLRSAAVNTRNVDDTVAGALPKPHGVGANERGYPGYFAANDFFNARPDAPPDADGNAPPSAGRWYSMGQIRVPDRSMFLVDSFAGEVIEPEGNPFGYAWDVDAETVEVDFRYGGVCLMLFLDGHVEPQVRWNTLHDLEGCLSSGKISPGRGVRIRDLTARRPELDPCP
jgi:prepilin-type N-terminal cleavage/methylation domain-containing protein/prepilin-type processing-associated H-X9-DG protein